MVLELLRRVGGIIRDYCGVLSEEAVRKNCVLVYELLDEVSGQHCSRSSLVGRATMSRASAAETLDSTAALHHLDRDDVDLGSMC